MFIAKIKHPVPRDVRQTLQLFRFYESEHGIASVLAHIDWVSVSPSQVYSAVLGRLPESREHAVPTTGYSARKHFEVTLNSNEFQETLIKKVAAAFPEKQRVVFIHIPRTAGTDFEENLAERIPSIHQILQDSRSVTKAELFLNLRNFAENIDLTNRMLICGHIPLKFYVVNNLRRFDDEFMTIVRDPIDILISHVNYILTVIRDRRDPNRPDRRNWLVHLGIDSVPEDMPDAEVRALALRIMRDEVLTPQDPLCSYLGNGTEESALNLLAITNIEITDVTRYSEWLRSRWDLARNTKKNASKPVLIKQDLSSEDFEWLRARTSKDHLLYSRIMDRLAAAGTLSINGLDVAMSGR